MRKVFHFQVDEIIPNRKDTFALQGISTDKKVSCNVLELFDGAVKLFMECVRPAGLVTEISKDDFETIYEGEGQNESSTPVADLFGKADKLALFAVTVGQGVHDRINALFGNKDFALGSMLDSVASAGVEKAADRVEAHFLDDVIKGRDTGKIRVVRYSPGYCGWNVSGQKKLFEYLKPEKIGIILRPSCLMEPLKSASGVLVVGKPEIHFFNDNYPFCGICETHSCRERIESLKGSAHAAARRVQSSSIDNL
jgi:hypothetical protein